jgi:hypothetical protein
MNLKRYIISFLLLVTVGNVFAQKEQIPDTNVPLNKLDAEGKRNGPWWISHTAGMGEPASAEFGSYYHGIKYGKWYKIDNEGDITAVETFKNDRMDGEVRYYNKGVLYCSGNYRTFRTGADKDSIWVMDPNTHDEFQREILADTNTMKHGLWRFYDENTGKLLREEEYQMDSLIYKNIIVSAQDSLNNARRESRLPHNKGKYKKVQSNPKGQVLN